ncbi:MAG: hypothetical protein K2Z81_03650, partial [Cyanobacteria bacterium]|nr:hypothetical protein [Cyanobacteriota bacterium]
MDTHPLYTWNPSMNIASVVAVSRNEESIQGRPIPAKTREYATTLIDRLGGVKAALSFSMDSQLWSIYMFEEEGDHERACDLTRTDESLVSSDLLLDVHEQVFGTVSFCMQTGEFTLARKVLKSLLDSAERHKDRIVAARAHLYLAEIALEQRDFSSSKTAARQALENLQHGETDSQLLAEAHNALVRVELAQGEISSAFEESRTAIKAANASNDCSIAQLRTLVLLTQVSMQSKKMVEADVFLKRALTLSEKISTNPINAPYKAEVLSEAGQYYLQTNDLERAKKLLSESLAVLRPLRLKETADQMAKVLNLLALVEFKQGHGEAASGFVFQSTNILESFYVNVFPNLSFREQAAFVTLLKDQEDILLSVCTEDDAALLRTFQCLSRWKGLLVESLRRQAIAARSIKDEELLARLFKLRGELAEQYFAKTPRQSASNSGELEEQERKLLQKFSELPGDLQNALKAKEEPKNALNKGDEKKAESNSSSKKDQPPTKPSPESDSRRPAFEEIVGELMSELFSANEYLKYLMKQDNQARQQLLLGGSLGSDVLGEVRKLMKTGEAIVDFNQYRDFSTGKLRYVAIVMGSRSSDNPEPKLIRLAASDDVNKTIAAWLNVATHGQVSVRDSTAIQAENDTDFSTDNTRDFRDVEPLIKPTQSHKKREEEIVIRDSLRSIVWEPIQHALPSDT